MTAAIDGFFFIPSKLFPTDLIQLWADPRRNRGSLLARLLLYSSNNNCRKARISGAVNNAFRASIKREVNHYVNVLDPVCARPGSDPPRRP